MAEGQVSEVSIVDFPTEILEIILKNVDVPSLFSARLVCRKWKVLSTNILHDRPETELSFEFNSDKKQYQLTWNDNEDSSEKDGKSLQDFIELVSHPESCSPFTRFALIDIQNWDESISNFLSIVSPTATCLKLKFARTASQDSGFEKKLRNLLLRQTPVLKELGLGFQERERMMMTQDQRRRGSKPSKLSLFPSSHSNKNDSDPRVVKLPKLHALHFGFGFEDELTAGIFRDICRVAPNLEKIQGWECDMESVFCCRDDFLFFLPLGKLNALTHVAFHYSSHFLSAWKNALEKMNIQSKDISSLFKIEDLQLSFDKQSSIKNRNQQELREAFHLVEQMFEGSKNTLEKLYISDTVPFPPGFCFPTFRKLSIVEFGHLEDDRSISSLFPLGCRLLNIFPNVGTLDLQLNFSNYLKRFFPFEDSTPVMPIVHTISFEGAKTNGEDVKIMALLCPNVKTLKHGNIWDICEEFGVYTSGAGLVDFPSFGRAVWSKMKNLESLHLIIEADTEANSFPALDSIFTGISKENCLRLFEESTNADVQNMNDNLQVKLQRESELKRLKVQESIMDLPKLKELNIKIQYRFDASGEHDATYKSSCEKNALSRMSRVSELYALKLIPGLKYEITSEGHL